MSEQGNEGNGANGEELYDDMPGLIPEGPADPNQNGPIDIDPNLTGLQQQQMAEFAIWGSADIEAFGDEQAGQVPPPLQVPAIAFSAIQPALAHSGSPLHHNIAPPPTPPLSPAPEAEDSEDFGFDASGDEEEDYLSDLSDNEGGPSL